MRQNVTIDGHILSLTCHAGRLSDTDLPNHLDGIRACLEANAFRVEIDIHSMADGDYLVSHASRLQESTTSQGSVGALTRQVALDLRRSDAPDQRPPLLSEVVNLAAGYETEVQLDLKDWRPLATERIDTLVSLVAPLENRVLISSGQDWNLRALHNRSEALRLGFDPDHYFASGTREVPVPARIGAYGYRDDHPLAIGRAQPASEYLRERMEALIAQCPFATEFFIEQSLLLQGAADGVSLADVLHDRGIAVSAWTVDYDGVAAVEVVRSLAATGVDHITTNTSRQFVDALSGTAV